MSDPMADTALLQSEAPPAPAIEDIAARLEAKFREGVSEAIQHAHAANLPVPVLGADNQVAWLHPDGSVRATREPMHGGGHQ